MIEEDVFGSRIEVSIAGGPSVELRIGLPGRFNVDNALLSFAVAHGLGLPIEAIVRGLAEPLPVPGRFEVIDAGQPFTVVVDYAHTPAALRRAIDSARSLAAGRVLVVFGAGGDRDREKRPEMGNVAATGSDRVFVTSDNPRWENPEAIVAEIMEGIPPELRARVQVHVDRQRAIHQALDQAEPGDLVLICGKGHETVQIIQGRSIPFDDRVVVGDYVRPRAAVPPGDPSRLGSSHG